MAANVKKEEKKEKKTKKEPKIKVRPVNRITKSKEKKNVQFNETDPSKMKSVVFNDQIEIIDPVAINVAMKRKSSKSVTPDRL